MATRARDSALRSLVTSGWKLSIGLAPVPEMLFWLGFLACFLGTRDWQLFGVGVFFVTHVIPVLFLSLLGLLGCKIQGRGQERAENGNKMLKR